MRIPAPSPGRIVLTAIADKEAGAVRIRPAVVTHVHGTPGTVDVVPLPPQIRDGVIETATLVYGVLTGWWWPPRNDETIEIG